MAGFVTNMYDSPYTQLHVATNTYSTWKQNLYIEKTDIYYTHS